MKVGILGSGIVGATLAGGLIKHGYEVMIGSRNPGKLADLKAKLSVQTGTFADAAEFGDFLILAVKGSAALEALELAGVEKLKGKTVIDTTNPIADTPPVNGVLYFFTDLDKSLMEILQETFPDANFVKAFSSVGNALMVNPDFGGLKPSMFIAGNDEKAKETVINLLNIFGWETEDMGKAEAARAIEPLCILWCIPGFNSNQWMHAFKLLKK